MTPYSIVESEPFFVDCTCGGNPGRFPEGFCEDCGNTGEVAAEPMCSLYTLAHNLAMAGGLCESFSKGAVYMARSVMRPSAPDAFMPGHALAAPRAPEGK